MARPTWRGAISFGLVNVPVQLFTAVRNHDLRFRQLHGETKRPVKQQRIDPETGDPVAYDELVKGYEIGDGRFVVVDKEELAELDPKASRLIDIEDYVEQEEIDPVYYDRPYYLAPDGETAAKPYKLLAEAMQRSGKVAIARFVMRDKEHLAAIRARDGLLVLSTMHHHDEVADPADIDLDTALADVTVRDREVDMAEQLIASMSTDFDPGAYRDEYRDRVLAYLEAKAEGEHVELPAASDDDGEIIDLMAALERSLARAGGGGDADDDGDERASGDGGRRGGDAQDYDAMTRGELYDLAQERQIPGRSSMTKAQLVTALRDGDAASGAA